MTTVRIFDSARRLSCAATRSTERLRLDVAVEQVAGDQEQVDLLGEREVDGGGEGGELPLTLGARLLAEVVVAGTEMDVGGMDDP